MRYSIVALLILCLAGTTFAQNLSTTQPPKSDRHVLSKPASDDRQGGETIAEAVPIGTLPWTDTGATCDNLDDYDETCPYTGSTSPDVVYSWVATFNGNIFADLCGSQYDTKLYMYDSGLNLIDCNDDYYYDDECGQFVSALDGSPVSTGETYYLVVDGYSGDCGEYILLFDEHEPPPPCELECPAGAQLEGEPPLEDDYVDNWNGGCGSDPVAFQWIDCSQVCGVCGWYLFDGSNYRDTDWYDCSAAGTEITWTCDAESETTFFHLGFVDCYDVTLLESMTSDGCDPVTMTITTTPGELVHLFVSSANFTNPGDVPEDEYDYVMSLEGIVNTSAIENQTWGGVKNLYR